MAFFGTALMLDDMPREDVVAIIDRMVNELLDSAQVTAPPVDAIALAQSQLGMVVCLDSRQVQRGRAQRSGGARQIYLRPEPREERHQWTVAHEIGEHMKSEMLARLGLDAADTKAMTGESLANLFAYRLLVPTRWFAADARDLDFDLLLLKKKYRTASHEVLAWRFLDLPESCIVTILDNDRTTRRRSNGWPIRRQLEPAEEKCLRQVQKHRKPQRVHQDGWTVQGWPVHEADWKRDILRTVVEAE